MSEIDRQRAEIDDLREDLNALELKGDERHDDTKTRLDYCCEALEYLVRIAKLERGEP